MMSASEIMQRNVPDGFVAVVVCLYAIVGRS